MRIGIITHYYKSENYGGNLQAYALCKVLKKLGHQAEQISFHRSVSKNLKFRISESVTKFIALRHICVNRQLRIRKKAIIGFNESVIPHSKLYTEKNIQNSLEHYDAYITGSDQVWHPSAYCDAYLLSFVPNTKIKLSYAASIATDFLPDQLKKKYKKELDTFHAISVREDSAVQLLHRISIHDAIVTLDPTLLLDSEEWEAILEPYPINEKYIFCYFLGDDLLERNIATTYAEKHGLKIVTLPYLLGKFRRCDEDFGDFKLYDVSPGKMLSLIKNAEYIFTDSFHATVFSLIFKRQHFVFPRAGAQSMSVRIETLTKLCGTQDYFCNTPDKATMEYIDSLSSIDYSEMFNEYQTMKKDSVRFLQENLDKSCMREI